MKVILKLSLISLIIISCIFLFLSCDNGSGMHDDSIARALTPAPTGGAPTQTPVPTPTMPPPTPTVTPELTPTPTQVPTPTPTPHCNGFLEWVAQAKPDQSYFLDSEVFDCDYPISVDAFKIYAIVTKASADGTVEGDGCEGGCNDPYVCRLDTSNPVIGGSYAIVLNHVDGDPSKCYYTFGIPSGTYASVKYYCQCLP